MTLWIGPHDSVYLVFMKGNWIIFRRRLHSQIVDLWKCEKGNLCVWCWAIWKETLFCVKLKKINNEPFKRNNSSAKTLFFPLSHVRETKSCFKHENNIFFSIFYFLSHVNEKKNLQEKKNCLKSFIILVTCKTNYSCPNFFFPPRFTRFS